jgi:Flp pilus assembly protein CpaB
MDDVVLQNARVLAIDQVADERTDKPSVVKAVTLEVDVIGAQKLSLAASIGSLTLMVSPLDTMGMAQAKGIGDFMDPEVTKLTKHIPKNDLSALTSLPCSPASPQRLIWNY